jgi:Ca2+-binding RTX toxin-like protein
MSGLIVALVVVGALAGGSGAFAGSGGLANATTLDLAAGPGENNAVTLAVSGTRLLLTDSAVVPTLSPTAAGLGCVLAGNTISCPKAGVTTVTIETGDGSDQVTIDPTLGTASSVGAIVVDGGSGDDSITNDSTVATTASYADSAAGVTVDLGSGSATGDGNDTLTGVTNVIGSSLGDSLSGDANANVLAGGGGSDLLAGRGGADTLDGGGGTDTVDYSAAAAGVVVDLAAGVASADGDGGSDTLVSVENVLGSSLGDSLSGDANANVLAGGGGSDLLAGRGGADTLDGGGGTDTVDYSAAAAGVVLDLASGVASADGDGCSDTLVSVENVIGSSLGDSLSGDANANVLAGGGGADNLVGGLGADTIDGWPGDDTISARDGIIDTITCGGGTDSVTADRNDVTAADCEQVQVPPPVVLIGETTLQRGIDQNVAGLAEAFSFVAAQTGTATEIQFYDDASSTASKVVVGLYADNGSGSPGSLLAQATRTALAGGAWNTVQISGAGLTAHVRYWLALLTPAGSGTLRFRDNCCGFKGPAPSQNSAQSNLSQLPATWAKGKVWPTDGPASLFAAR